LETELAGVRAARWLLFLLAVSEGGDEATTERKLLKLLDHPMLASPRGELAERILNALIGEDHLQ
jgi:hypothetical protein